MWRGGGGVLVSVRGRGTGIGENRGLWRSFEGGC